MDSRKPQFTEQKNKEKMKRNLDRKGSFNEEKHEN